MAEFIAILQEVKQLPSELHLLCPRQNDDDQDRYEDDNDDIDGETSDGTENQRRAKIEDARKRRKKFISSLQLLAYDGNESEQYQRFIWQSLDNALSKCDLCIREYYVGRIDLLSALREDYDEDDIKTFFDIINKRDIDRIRDGLVGAVKTLRELPENKRGMSSIASEHLHALFEALVCDAFLSRQDLLRTYFDEPFKLIQSKKPLRIREILPATVRFLFDTNPTCVGWATSMWSRLDRCPSELEWNWSIKEFVQGKLQQASEPTDIARLWSALRIVVTKLDEKQITHKLLDLVPNICITSLNHLARKTQSVSFILQTIKTILEKAPDAYWQAMGSISSQTIVEQIFTSYFFNKFLGDKSDTAEFDVVSWAVPFIRSMKPGNRPAACHTIVNQLFERVKSDQLHLTAKTVCFEMAIQVILETTSTFSDDERNRQSVERIVISDLLDTISHRIDEILRPRNSALAQSLSVQCRHDVLGVVQKALSLECQCLKSDFEILTKKEPLRHESSSYSPDIWESITNNLNDTDVALTTAVLEGLVALPGLEQFRERGSQTQKKEKESFNTIFEKMTGMVTKILERIAEFKPEHLDGLFKAQNTNMALIAALFSADQKTYEAAIDLIKNISGESGRKEAIAHVLEAFLTVTLNSMSWTFRRICNMKTFASVPRLLKTGMEILDELCNPSTGKLRDPRLLKEHYKPIHLYWSHQWNILRSIFRQTEQWSIEVHDKPFMMEVCRDAMQYAEALFEQYNVFAGALISIEPERISEVPELLLDASDNQAGSPIKTLTEMAKWLRLRDDYLVDTLVKLITKMLYQLTVHKTLVKNEEFAYVEAVAMKSTVKTILSPAQKAILVQALENYYGRPLEKPTKKQKQSTLREWTESAAVNRTGTSTPASHDYNLDEFGDAEIADDDLVEILDPTKKATKAGDNAKPLTSRHQLPTKPILPDAALMKAKARQALDSKAFIEKRKQEEAARKLRDKEAALKLRGKTGVGEQTNGQGSSLLGLGVKGKDHSSGPNSLMVSSESESDSEADSDDELFGKVQKAQPTVRELTQGGRKPLAIGPVKKIKQIRSHKDIRARLAPDLSTLHKTILSWDFFSDTDFPPNSSKDDYTLVTNTFKSAIEYLKTFEPLLILEGWQSFRAAREDSNFKAFDIKVASSLLVDSFFEINTQMPLAEGKDLGINAADVVLLSKSKQPHDDPDQPHCLARVKEISRKKGEIQVIYRVNAAHNPMRQFLNNKAIVYGVQILSLTPLEREFGALMALPYYDLCDEIITAKPSPLLEYSEDSLKDITSTYEINLAQAKAVKSALDNDAFTLIQGPPGSGKTKTIAALVGAMMTGFLNKDKNAPKLNTTNARSAVPPPAVKKVLVCAPSNAAVDELVMRLKEGVKLLDGSKETLSVVRLGRSDAINSKVKDVTLEELVNAKLNLNAPTEAKEDIYSFMTEHKATSDELQALKNKMSDIRAKGQSINAEDENLFDGLKRKQKALSYKIDSIREKQNTASRDNELSRKRIQQQILDSAHVLCATLSGSGHEIFQGLNVEFETVIIDEAAQSIELSALIPLKYGCSKCILVGDPKQLPPTVLSRQAARFQYEQSLFARMENNHQKHVHLLDTQYRMHPDISIFPSQTFYDGRLKDGPDMTKIRTRPWHHSQIFAPYRFFDVQGMSQAATKGHSLVNTAELNVAMKLYDRLISDVPKYNFNGKIGIITPYKGQLKELKARFKQKYGESITSTIEFNTTDAFQGRESEIIIFSCVRASTKGIGFLNDIRRMNVGLTRAKCSLWVLGNSQSLIQGEFWKALVNNAKQRNLYTEGDILAMLKRPLLTEDMMKDDVMMEDIADQDSKLSTCNTSSNGTKSDHSIKSSKDVKSGEQDMLGKKTIKTEASIPSRPSSGSSRASTPSSTSSAVRPVVKREPSSSTNIGRNKSPQTHDSNLSSLTQQKKLENKLEDRIKDEYGSEGSSSAQISQTKSAGQNTSSGDGKRKFEKDHDDMKPKISRTSNAPPISVDRATPPAPASVTRSGLPPPPTHGAPRPPQGMIRKKKHRSDDMFMKKK